VPARSPVEYRHRLRIDDAAGVGLGGHGVQGGAGLALAVQHRPVDRHAAAVLGQQRAVHVVRAARGRGQERGAQQLAVVEREQEVRARGAHALYELGGVGVGRRGDLETVPARVPGDALKPDLLARGVRVRDHQRHRHLVLQQHAQAAHAHVVVGKHDRAGHSGSCGRSSTAPTM
jgi:hypothetical protein